MRHKLRRKGADPRILGRCWDGVLDPLRAWQRLPQQARRAPRRPRSRRRSSTWRRVSRGARRGWRGDTFHRWSAGAMMAGAAMEDPWKGATESRAGGAWCTRGEVARARAHGGTTPWRGRTRREPSAAIQGGGCHGRGIWTRIAGESDDCGRQAGAVAAGRACRTVLNVNVYNRGLMSSRELSISCCAGIKTVYVVVLFIMTKFKARHNTIIGTILVWTIFYVKLYFGLLFSSIVRVLSCLAGVEISGMHALGLRLVGRVHLNPNPPALGQRGSKANNGGHGAPRKSACGAPAPPPRVPLPPSRWSPRIPAHRRATPRLPARGGRWPLPAAAPAAGLPVHRAHRTYVIPAACS
jgi:hypothetical protein